MNLKKIYLDLKEKVRNYFGKEESLTKEQRDYVLSGINPEILDNYKIIYFPTGVYYKKHSGGTQIERGLEKKLIDYKIPFLGGKGNYFQDVCGKIKKIHYDNMKTIRLNHLKRMNEIYSSVVETYNKEMKNMKDVLVENFSDGRVKVSFG
jgi:hypothetical protein